jgi:RNA polymerase sigma-70 factor (ECF subfamily)
MVIASESDRLIMEAIEKLPAQQKQIFAMSRWEGLSREEIPARLQISSNTVKNHLYQAIKFIKTQMGASYLTFCLFYWSLEK